MTTILKFGVNHAKFDKLTWFPGDDSFLKKNLISFFQKSKNFDLVNGYRSNREVFNFQRNFLSSLNQFLQSLLFNQVIKDVHGMFIF